MRFTKCWPCWTTGIDEVGYALVSRNEIRIRDGYPRLLARNGMVDRASLLGLMHGAAEQRARTPRR